MGKVLELSGGCGVGETGAYLCDGDGLVRHDGLWDGAVGQTMAVVVAVVTEALP
jgi:hypothetical protein